MNKVGKKLNLPLAVTTMELIVIAAVDKNGGIGLAGGIPWSAEPYASHDMKNFSTLTRSNDKTVIMGRLTYESLPDKFRPLPGRVNIVISSSYTNDATFGKAPRFVPVNSFDAAVEWCLRNEIARPAVVGGARVYEAALKHPNFHTAYITNIPYDGPTDVKFPVDLLKGLNVSMAPLPTGPLILSTYTRGTDVPVIN